jgi:hypothetical protein
MLRHVHHARQQHVRELPGHGGGHARLRHALAAAVQRAALQFLLQQRVGRMQLAGHAVKPWRVHLLGWAQLVLVHDLHRLLAGGQRQADHAQVVLAGLDVGGYEAALGGSDRFCVVEDERGIHQHLAVVAHQRRRLHHRIDGLELLEGAKHRDGSVLEGNAHQVQRDRDAADVRRIEHADELHGSCPRGGCGGSGGFVEFQRQAVGVGEEGEALARDFVGA